MKVADTFQTYHSFFETFELHKQGQNALYHVYASETVQNYLKKHFGSQLSGRQDIGIPDIGAFLHIRH